MAVAASRSATPPTTVSTRAAMSAVSTQINPPLTPYPPSRWDPASTTVHGATGCRDPPLLGRRLASMTAPRQCLLPRILPFIDMDSCSSTP
uniref:Uncharacterized protein n=1 Tax=Triticum urartu TaxID=4572 RepID=A0A8R7VC18_TRIUA